MSVPHPNWQPSARHRACVAMAAAAFGVHARDLVGSGRRHGLSRARFAAYWLLRERFALSWPLVARCLDRVDHSTSIYGGRQAEKLRRSDADFCARTDALLRAPIAPIGVVPPDWLVALRVRDRRSEEDEIADRLTRWSFDRGEAFAPDEIAGARRLLHGSAALEAAIEAAGGWPMLERVA